MNCTRSWHCQSYVFGNDTLRLLKFKAYFHFCSMNKRFVELLHVQFMFPFFSIWRDWKYVRFWYYWPLTRGWDFYCILLNRDTFIAHFWNQTIILFLKDKSRFYFFFLHLLLGSPLARSSHPELLNSGFPYQLPYLFYLTTYINSIKSLKFICMCSGLMAPT